MRTKGDPHLLATAVTAAVHEVGPNVPVTDVLSMDDILAHHGLKPGQAQVLDAANGVTVTSWRR